MSERQNKRFVLSVVNGMDFEVVGTSNMRVMTHILEDCRLKIRYVDSKPKEPNVDVVKRLQKPK